MLRLKELHMLLDAVLAPRFEPSPELHIDRCDQLLPLLDEAKENVLAEKEKYKNIKE